MQVTFAQRAYEHIRDKLLSGEMTPGTRLVNRALAEEIGVSAIPVREAISRLASEGLVAHVSGAGAFVRQPDRQELIELYGLREALETHVVAEAARCITEEELAALEKICDDWQETVRELRAGRREHATRPQLARWVDNDERFHRLLLAAARNRLLSKVVAGQRLLTQVFGPMRRDPSVLTPDRAEATCRSHRDLVQALRRRDAEEARRCMSQQIRTGLKHSLDHADRARTEGQP